MSKCKRFLVGFGVAVFAMASAAGAKAPEWSYSYENDEFTLSISSSPCYDNNENATVSMRLCGTKQRATISADASCDCGEAMVIDNGKPITPASFAQLITPASFAQLVSDAVSTQIKSYTCKTIE